MDAGHGWLERLLPPWRIDDHSIFGNDPAAANGTVQHRFFTTPKPGRVCDRPELSHGCFRDRKPNLPKNADFKLEVGRIGAPVRGKGDALRGRWEECGELLMDDRFAGHGLVLNQRN